MPPFNQAFWDAVRPLHRPLTRMLRRRLGRNYAEHPEMRLPPPYEMMQLEVERNLHGYLHVAPEAIQQVVIVGMHEADEIPRMRRTYPNVRFLGFEPNPDSYARLQEMFAQQPDVGVRKLALADQLGATTFYEMDQPGNGSLLRPDPKGWAEMTQWKSDGMRSFEVQLSTLDREAAHLSHIDLLWMDVQGAEGLVLAGGGETLRRTRAVFLEVALTQSPYQGTVLFPEVSARLKRDNFTCTGMGIDGWNGTGNALFIRDFEQFVLQPTKSAF
jgi:FkbM family methyltransferase